MRRRTWAGATGLLGVAALAAAGLTGGAGTASATTACDTPPAVFPESSLKAGMTGTGYTVVKGTTPASFKVKILGVLPDGIAPGVDFVAVQVSGSAVASTGIAAGFSGSPVYINGKLAGAISYGFDASDPSIGGMTPAQPMMDLFGYPTGGAVPAAAPAVKLTPALRSAVSSAAGVASSSLPASAHQLSVPVAVSGLNDRGLARMQTFFRRGKLPFLPYRAGVAATPSGASSGAPLAPGDSVAATISYGDVTVGGIGTLTATCGSEAVAFGHPMLFDGATQMGLNASDVVTVVPSILEPFKLANVDAFQGIVDQDRLVGIRGVQGALPRLIPVTASVTNPDLGRSRAGRTDVVRESFLGLVAGSHVLSDEDVVFDRVGDGSASLGWTIDGTRANGAPFHLRRTDLYYSPYDISYETVNELTGQIGAIEGNPFERVHITDVHVTSRITQARLTASIVRVESASLLNPRMVPHARLHVLPGETVRLRVWLHHPDGAENAVPLRVKVPAGLRFGGGLVVRGGIPLGGCQFCGPFGGSSAPKATSFPGLLQSLENGERHSDLVASVIGFNRVAPSTSVSHRSSVILGRRLIDLIVG
jgi:hypothetical protein